MQHVKVNYSTVIRTIWIDRLNYTYEITFLKHFHVYGFFQQNLVGQGAVCAPTRQFYASA